VAANVCAICDGACDGWATFDADGAGLCRRCDEGAGLFEQALALVESKSIRAWASTAHNRPVWLRIAERTAAKGGPSAEPVRFAAYITLTAMGA
jgi:hypothetical protein